MKRTIVAIIWRLPLPKLWRKMLVESVYNNNNAVYYGTKRKRFTSKDDAEKFAKEHKGEVVSGISSPVLVGIVLSITYFSSEVVFYLLRNYLDTPIDVIYRILLPAVLLSSLILSIKIQKK